MTGLTDRHWFLLAVACYGLSTVYTVFLWRRGFRRDDRVNYLLLLAGLLCHTTAMVKRGFTLDRCPINNLFEATMFIAWTLVAGYLAVGSWARVRFLGAFTSPILLAMGIFALFPQLDPPHGAHPQFQGGLTTLHATLVFLAYGAFGLSSVAAAMYLLQEHNLKFNKFKAVVSLMPPIQRLEVIVDRAMVCGFVLLTVGLGLSARLERPAGVQYIEDPKVIWSLAVWAGYGILLLLRWYHGPRGRRAAWGSVGSFLFVLLTFWGMYLLSPIHNPP